MEKDEKKKVETEQQAWESIYEKSERIIYLFFLQRFNPEKEKPIFNQQHSDDQAFTDNARREIKTDQQHGGWEG